MMARRRELLKHLQHHSVFTLDEAIAAMGGCPQRARQHVKNLVRFGHAQGIRRGLWHRIDAAHDEARVNPLLVANRIVQPYAVSYLAALHIHADLPMPGVICIASPKRFADFEYQDTRYVGVHFTRADLRCAIQEVHMDGETVACMTPEWSLALSATRPHRAMGLQALFACLQHVPRLDAHRVLEAARHLDLRVAYRRIGYLLDYFQTKWRVPGEVLGAFQEHAAAVDNDIDQNWGGTFSNGWVCKPYALRVPYYLGHREIPWDKQVMAPVYRRDGSSTWNRASHQDAARLPHATAAHATDKPI